jgi:hypothetical protein
MADKEGARPGPAINRRRHRFVTQTNTIYVDIIDTAREKPEGKWIARVWSRVEASEIIRLLNRHSMTKFLGRGKQGEKEAGAS